MKRNIIISTISMMAVMPVFADIAVDNDSPVCDSATIGATSGSTSLDAMWTIVNQTCNPGQYFNMSTATCETCSANSYCPGGTYNVESQSNGLNSCPNDYGLSATGSSAQTDCYRTCTTNDVAHSATVSGGYYYNNNNRCAATSCAAGWHVKPGLNLASEFTSANPTNSSSAYVNVSGTYTTLSDLQQSETGLTQSNTWATKFDGMGMVYGLARCSKTPGNSGWSVGWNNVTTFNSLTDETGEEDARYCYCNITGYKPVNGQLQSLSSAWVFRDGGYDGAYCVSSCALECANNVRLITDFRGVMFDAVTPGLASCEANTINIKWYNENTVHDENTCTYSQTVTLPETDPQRTGYNFTGWTVRPNNVQN